MRTIASFASLLLVAGLLLHPQPSQAAPTPSATVLAPTIDQQVDELGRDFEAQVTRIARRYGLSPLQVWTFSELLNRPEWDRSVRGLGLSKERMRALKEDLGSLPHRNFGELTPYNLLVPSKDKWGYTWKEGLRGWERYRPYIEQAAIEQGLDPMILGAYVWTESNFNTNQDNRDRGMYAIGLGSVQAQYHPELGPLETRIRRLKEDPLLNLRITAKEFRAAWNPKNMYGTVMDVWYPAWRRRSSIPNLGNSYAYMQLFSNRYFMLIQIMGS